MSALKNGVLLRNRKAENRPLMKVIYSLLLLAPCLSALMISCCKYFLITVKLRFLWVFSSLLSIFQDFYNLVLAKLNKSFPIFRTIDFCKKAPLLSHLQIPAYTLTELFCKNYTTLQIKSGIAPSVACQIVLKSIVYIVLFCHNWTIYFTQFS